MRRARNCCEVRSAPVKQPAHEFDPCESRDNLVAFGTKRSNANGPHSKSAPSARPRGGKTRPFLRHDMKSAAQCVRLALFASSIGWPIAQDADLSGQTSGSRVGRCDPDDRVEERLEFSPEPNPPATSPLCSRYD